MRTDSHRLSFVSSPLSSSLLLSLPSSPHSSPLSGLSLSVLAADSEDDRLSEHSQTSELR